MGLLISYNVLRLSCNRPHLVMIVKKKKLYLFFINYWGCLSIVKNVHIYLHFNDVYKTLDFMCTYHFTIKTSPCSYLKKGSF